tara:strand:+ start:174 stop:617 length:444 start_codon:yes stop_codon:yes gene_type:complete
MIYISHRGNLTGKKPEMENKPSYISDALNQGYHCEVDVWFVNNKFMLGHDEPKYGFPFVLFRSFYNKLWIHCKNVEAISALNDFPETHLLNYFWHQNDDVTLTSKGYIWAYPGKQPIKSSIAVLPEIHNDDTTHAIGICSDNIKKYK